MVVIGMLLLVGFWWGAAMLAAYVTWPPEESEEVKRLNAERDATVAESRRRVA